jgi:hypothetical protein
MRRIHRRLALGLGVALAVATACQREPATVGRLESAIADYAGGMPTPSPAEIDALFKQLDADIAVLRAEAAKAPDSDAGMRADALQRRRTALWQQYVQAHVQRARAATENVVRSVGKQVGQNLEDAGRRIQDAIQ